MDPNFKQDGNKKPVCVRKTVSCTACPFYVVNLAYDGVLCNIQKARGLHKNLLERLDFTGGYHQSFSCNSQTFISTRAG